MSARATGRRRPLRPAVAGVLLSTILAGCAVDGTPPTVPGFTEPTFTPTVAKPATTTGTAIGGAATPEEAATGYLRAWAAGDPLALCLLTTDKTGKVIARTPEAERLCVNEIARHVAAVKDGMAPLAEATVGKVTMSSETVGVPDPATVRPEQALPLAATLTIVQVQGRWFVRTGAS